MKTLSGGLQTAFRKSPRKFARLFTLTTNDITLPPYYFTDHSQSITYNSNVYVASGAISMSAVESTTGGIASNSEIKINYVDGITRDMLLSGNLDQASLWCDVIVWDEPSQGVVRILDGYIQRKDVNNVSYGSFNVKGRLNLTDGFIGEVYTPECRNVFGDSNCSLDVNNFDETFTVGAVVSGQAYTRFAIACTGTRADGFFNLGYVRFGINGTRYEILKDSAPTLPTARDIILAVPTQNILVGGETGVIVAGCDKRHASCLTKFDNILNFRGEPFNPTANMAV